MLIVSDARYFESVLTESNTQPTVSELAKACLSHCSRRHDCNARDDRPFPTRVIDVGGLDKDTLRLYTPTISERGKYAALSYCWGRSKPFVTTAENLKDHQDGFSLQSLPRTLRDAVQVTRDVGLRYLWVDALCIVQGTDSLAHSDWASEVRNMDRVYSNAYVTISAAAARHANDGLFTKGRCLLPSVGTGGFVSISWTKAPLGFRHEPLYSRAWALQEHILSPRLLIYTRFGLVWQCDQAKLGKLIDSRNSSLSKVYTYRLPDSCGVQDWNRLVEFFCSRDLSKPRDKLHAIAALAQRYHEATGDQYLAGLWRSTMLCNLLWFHHPEWLVYPTSMDHRPDEYRAPSWSWASIDGTVLLRTRTNGPGHAEIVDCQVELADPENPFGEVTAGSLRIRGPLIEVRWKNTDGQSLPKVYTCNRTGPSVNDAILGDLFLDEPRNGPQSSRELVSSVCLLIGDRNRHHALMLRLLPGSKDTYSRIGLVRNDESAAPAVWRDVPVVAITIV